MPVIAIQTARGLETHRAIDWSRAHSLPSLRSLQLLRLENEGSPPRTRTIRHHSSLDENEALADEEPGFALASSTLRSISATSFASEAVGGGGGAGRGALGGGALGGAGVGAGGAGAGGGAGGGAGAGARAATLGTGVGAVLQSSAPLFARKEGLTIDIDAANKEDYAALTKPPQMVKMIEGRDQTPFFDQAASGRPSHRLTPLASPFRKRRKSAVMNHFRPFTGFARPPGNQRQSSGKRPRGAGLSLKVRGSGR